MFLLLDLLVKYLKKVHFLYRMIDESQYFFQVGEVSQNYINTKKTIYMWSYGHPIPSMILELDSFSGINYSVLLSECIVFKQLPIQDRNLFISPAWECNTKLINIKFTSPKILLTSQALCTTECPLCHSWSQGNAGLYPA